MWSSVVIVSCVLLSQVLSWNKVEISSSLTLYYHMTPSEIHLNILTSN